MDIYLDALRLGIYPPLSTSPSGHSCILFFEISVNSGRIFTKARYIIIFCDYSLKLKGIIIIVSVYLHEVISTTLDSTFAEENHSMSIKLTSRNMSLPLPICFVWITHYWLLGGMLNYSGTANQSDCLKHQDH